MLLSMAFAFRKAVFVHEPFFGAEVGGGIVNEKIEGLLDHGAFLTGGNGLIEGVGRPEELPVVFIHFPDVGPVFVPPLKDGSADHTRIEHLFHAPLVGFEKFPADDGDVQEHLPGDSEDQGLFGDSRPVAGKGC